MSSVTLIFKSDLKMSSVSCAHKFRKQVKNVAQIDCLTKCGLTVILTSDLNLSLVYLYPQLHKVVNLVKFA